MKIFGIEIKRKSELDGLRTEINSLRSAVTSYQGLMKRGFNAAMSNNVLAGWATIAKAINYDIKQGGTALIARARELEKNDPYAKKVLNAIKNGVVGPKGFMLRVKAGEYQQFGTDYKFVEDKIANQKIQEAWWDWNKMQHCSIIGNTSFRELNGTIIKRTVCDGEVFIAELKGKKFGKWGYQLQYIDPLAVDFQLNRDLPNGNRIVMGIELNDYFKPVAYWVRKTNPRNDTETGQFWSNDYEVIPAERMIHLFIKETPNQIRGVTMLAPVAIRMKMLYEFEEAGLTRSRASASIPWALEPKDGADPEITGDDEDEDGNQLVEIEAGQLYQIPDGYSIKNIDSNYPHPMYEMFLSNVIRGIAAALPTSSITLSGNYSNVNYTSSRTALLEERDAFIELQSWFTEMFLERVFAGWLEMALTGQSLKLPPEKFEKFNYPTFIGRRWQWVDPKNEVDASVVANDNLIKPLEQIYGEMGMDLEETLQQFANEKELLKKYGLEKVKPGGYAAPANNGSNGNGSNGKSEFKYVRM